jgi:hypothetical protein
VTTSFSSRSSAEASITMATVPAPHLGADPTVIDRAIQAELSRLPKRQ